MGKRLRQQGTGYRYNYGHSSSHKVISDNNVGDKAPSGEGKNVNIPKIPVIEKNSTLKVDTAQITSAVDINAVIREQERKSTNSTPATKEVISEEKVITKKNIVLSNDKADVYAPTITDPVILVKKQNTSSEVKKVSVTDAKFVVKDARNMMTYPLSKKDRLKNIGYEKNEQGVLYAKLEYIDPKDDKQWPPVRGMSENDAKLFKRAIDIIGVTPAFLSIFYGKVQDRSKVNVSVSALNALGRHGMKIPPLEGVYITFNFERFINIAYNLGKEKVTKKSCNYSDYVRNFFVSEKAKFIDSYSAYPNVIAMFSREGLSIEENIYRSVGEFTDPNFYDLYWQPLSLGTNDILILRLTKCPWTGWIMITPVYTTSYIDLMCRVRIFNNKGINPSNVMFAVKEDKEKYEHLKKSEDFIFYNFFKSPNNHGSFYLNQRYFGFIPLTGNAESDKFKLNHRITSYLKLGGSNIPARDKRFDAQLSNIRGRLGRSSIDSIDIRNSDNMYSDNYEIIY